MAGTDAVGVVRRVALGSVVGLAVAGCDQPAPPPPTVIVNTPPADGGSLVLVTVLIAVAFALGAVAVVCAWGWLAERRSRREAETGRRVAEDVVVALTGHPAGGPLPALLAVRPDGVWPVLRELAAGQTREDRAAGPGAGAGR